MSSQVTEQPEKYGTIAKLLDLIETLGNKLPDPAVLFLAAMAIVWIASLFLSGMEFSEINPKTGDAIVIVNQLSGEELVRFMKNMVKTFTGFAPLGVVLVAMLGVGVAEHSGYINAGLKLVLGVSPRFLMTPILILVGIASHTATDAGYVLVIPLGGIIFHAAGRHPLAGIAAGFAAVSGGFSANFIISALDPLLQSFTQSAARLVDADINVNVLCNYYFASASSLLITAIGWFLTDKIVEPRLEKHTPLDPDVEPAADLSSMEPKEVSSFWAATSAMVIGLIVVFALVWPADSILRHDGSWSNFQAPIMQMIVPLIFLLFVLPGVIFGFMTGNFKGSKDIIGAMSKAMTSMGYYMVMIFFCALFVDAFGQSNIGTLIAVKGANTLKEMNMPAGVTIVGIIILTGVVNLLVGSASGKWGLISPIFVPMLMQLGISPDLTQAAYRVGDSTTNIITPLMPYFPLVVVYAQRYVKKTGIGSLVSLMLPYSICMFVLWTLFLLVYWALGIPLGVDASYTYTP